MNVRRYLLPLLALELLSGAASLAVAQTGSGKTPTQLNSEINLLWPDNTTRSITPFNARQTLLDIVASYANGSYTAPYSGAVARSLAAKLGTDLVSILDFGADSTGVADSTTAVVSALATGKDIYAPTGTYKLSGASCPTFSTTGQKLYGDGRGATVFSSTCTNNTFTVNNGTQFVEMRDFKITRTGTAAVSGQDGIHCNTLCDYMQIENVWIENHYNGFRLAGASFNKLINGVANNNQNHGVLITNTDGCAGLQWTLINNLSQQNNGDGYRWEAVSCSASVGEMINDATFANKGKGARFQGTSGTIRLEGPRLTYGFYGADCDDEIYLDTYAATSQKVHGAFAELAGISACGVNLGTAATNAGKGISITANNTFVSVLNNILIQNSQNGIETSATFSQVNENNLRLNGNANGVGERSGIQINAGAATVTGNVSQGNTQFGLRVLVDNVTVAGNDFCNNPQGGIAAIVLAASLINDNACAGLGVLTTPPSNVTGVNGLNSNLAMPAGQYSYLRVTGPTGAFSVGGITGGSSGRILHLQNTTTQTMTIVNEDASSTAANRITTLSGANFVLASGATSAVTLIYDGVASRWILTAAQNRGTISVPEGGTGLTSGTSGGVPYFSSGTTIASSAALAAGQVVVGGGAGTTPATIANGQLPATATNDDAASTKVGEYVSSTIASGSAVSLSTNTQANITSISLTAGDWDIDLVAQFTGNTTTTVSSQECSISTTSATLDYTGGKGVALTGNATPYNQIAGTSAIGCVVPPIRMSLSGTTTVYGVARSIFGTSTSSVYGLLRARRER